MRRVKHINKPDTTRNSPGLEETIQRHKMLEEGKKAVIVKENRNTIRIVLR